METIPQKKKRKERKRSKPHKNGREAFFFVLKSLKGPFKGKKFEIPDWKPVVFKRSETSLTPSFHRRLGEICLPDPDVSRLHAKISFKGGRFEILDLGSLNGTFLNDKRLSPERVPLDEPVVLGNGDKLIIGQTLFEVSIYKRFATISEEVEYEQGQDWKDVAVRKRDVLKEERAGTVPKRHIRVADLPVSQQEALKRRLAIEEEEDNIAVSKERNVFVDGLLPNKETVSRTILSVLAYNRRLDDIQSAQDGHTDSSCEEEDSSSSHSEGSSSSEKNSSESEEEDNWTSIRKTAGKQLNTYIESSEPYICRGQISRLQLKRKNFGDLYSSENVVSDEAKCIESNDKYDTAT
ncbi:uncharacterized protein Gasu_03340 [Galdieria sulphuraria]|uniref:FHA domain-containing protein n=1 Tax=Galdieria sulphuraria TaxID=130081 RepID=M2XQQ1_GALSU|nr:uncharacterized protein Gasu_03340 [Galdieria sulphuraria]EME32562.1 hypothetical protein Gasu_03340 [Galdieria sulphuraria]|eukprot:XP_005709082.1 hypothetical protein Gasu_03340 [Galdieria sulphuraria]